MPPITESVKSKVLKYCAESLARNGYDFWEEHIKYVVNHARELAAAQNADVTVCELAALLHDVSLPANVGPREEHEVYGAKMAREILSELNFDPEKIEHVAQCILSHRGSKSAERKTNEEWILAEADALSHFDNIPMIFSLAYGEKKMPMAEGREYVKKKLQKSFDKLRPETKDIVKPRLDNIMNVLFNT